MDVPHRYPVIFNPYAKSQKGSKVLRFIEKNSDYLTLHPTNYPGEARKIAAAFAASGEPVVIAAGGDGTLNEVVGGLLGSRTVLGILPSGTMNVFARELQIPCNSLDQAFQIIIQAFVQEVDLFGVNGAPFVQMAGVGFDATVIEQTTWQSKKMLGPLAYLVAAAKILGERPPRLEIICDDGRREEGVAVLVGNGSLYGGPFKVFRNAKNTDSLLEVIIYKEAGYRLILDSLCGLVKGSIDEMDSTRYLQTNAFTVKSAEEVPVQVDGEWLGRFSTIRFVETPHRLRVIAPEDAFIGGTDEKLKSFFQWPKLQKPFQTARSL